MNQVHPEIDQLSAFALGQLESAALDAVENHLANCPACCDTLNQIKEDTFVGLVRQAKVDEGNASSVGLATQDEADSPRPLAEAATLAAADHTPSAAIASSATEPAAAILVADIPADLANHARYRIEELIGTGGMGAVFKAEHRMMKRSVALKVINPKFIQSKQAAERFRREVEAAGRLVHPNIVHSYDAEQAGDVHFLIMEYVKGTDLQKVLEQRGPLPVAEACEYIRQAAVGLQHAHENGMVHRDIKPQNLMVASVDAPARSASKAEGPPLLAPRAGTGIVKILDFGLASLTTEAVADDAGNQPSTLDSQKSGLTQAGSLMGTPDYMAPEQGRDAHAADIRSDIYSLGCTLYALLAGKVPFPGGTAIDKVIAHSTNHAQPIGELRKDVPAALVNVLDKMMAKDPAERYQTPAEVAAALSPLSLLGRGAGGEGRSHRRKTGALLTAAAGFVLLLGGIIYVTTDNGQLKIESSVDDVQVVVSKGGKEIEVIDLKSGSTVKRLPSGAYDIKLKGDRVDAKLDRNGFTMTRWGEIVVKLTEEKTLAKSGGEKVGGVRRFKGHSSTFGAGVAFSPDGRSAFSRENSSIQQWDLETGREGTQWQLEGPLGGTAISRDGKRAVAGVGENIVLLNLETGKTVGRIKVPPIHGVKAGIQALALAPDARRAISVTQIPWQGEPIGWRGSIRLWDLEQLKEIRCLEDDVYHSWTCAFSPDGKTVLTGGGSGMRLWDVETGKVLQNFGPHGHWYQCVAFSPDGHRAVSGGGDGFIRLWDIETGKELRRFEAHQRLGNPNEPMVVAVAFSPDGRRILSGGDDRTVALWDTETGQPLHRFTGHQNVVDSVAFSPDGHYALSGSRDGTVRLWRLPEPPSPASPNVRETLQLKGHSAGVETVAWSQDGRRLASASWDRTVKVWDATSGKMIHNLAGHAGPVNAVAFSVDGRHLASGSEDCTVKLWDTETGKEIHTFQGHSNYVDAVAFAPGGKTLASGSWDGTIKLWNLTTHKLVHTFAGHKGWVRGVAFSPKGDSLASASNDGGVKVWDPASGQEKFSLQGNTGPMLSVTFSPDGQRLATCGEDEKVKVWNLTSRTVIATGRGHTGVVYSLDFHPNGKHLVSGATDQLVKVWDATTGENVLTLQGHNLEVRNVKFSPDGLRLASAGGNWSDAAKGGEVKVWDVSLPRWPAAAQPEPGWTPLFNGKNLEGWFAKFDQSSWAAADGVIIGKGVRPDFLITKRNDFENFHLRLEAKINKGGSGGIFFRGGGKHSYETQVSLADGHAKTGSLWNYNPGLIYDEKRDLIQPDTWFTVDIIAQGNHIVTKINGQTTADVHDDTNRKGDIELQVWQLKAGDTFAQFRKIEIKELPPTAAAPKK